MPHTHLTLPKSETVSNQMERSPVSGGPAPSAHAAKDAACRFFGKLEDFNQTRKERHTKTRSPSTDFKQ